MSTSLKVAGLNSANGSYDAGEYASESASWNTADDRNLTPDTAALAAGDAVSFDETAAVPAAALFQAAETQTSELSAAEALPAIEQVLPELSLTTAEFEVAPEYKINALEYTVNAPEAEEAGAAPVLLGAAPVDYIDYDADGNCLGTKQCTNYTLVTSSQTTWGTAGEETWYVVDGTVNCGAITVNGEVHLILKDGSKLTATSSDDNAAGITVTGENNALTIYAQSTTDQMGILEAKGTSESAGIGGGTGCDGCNITINGGDITATGGEYGAGIGGGEESSGAYITINGGDITATSEGDGAGIGGGKGGLGAYITINGGDITATSEGDGAGIGGGSTLTGGEITINGGTINATGAYGGAGIGGGNYASADNIFIYGGTITATSTDGAGIGAGSEGDVYSMYIRGGTITATSTNGAGIGGGSGSNSSQIDVYNGYVKASSENGDSIGSGADGEASFEIKISAVLKLETTSGDPIPHDMCTYLGEELWHVQLKPLDADVKCLNNSWTTEEQVLEGIMYKGDYVGTGTVNNANFYYNDESSFWASTVAYKVVSGGTYANGATCSGTTVELRDGIFSKAVSGDCTQLDIKGGTYQGTVTASGANLTVSSGSFARSLLGGAVYSAEATPTAANTFTVTGGTFNGLVCAGDAFTGTTGAFERTAALSLTITGGTFNSQVAGGMFYCPDSESSGSATVDGNTILRIAGGTFNGYIYGGSTAKTADFGDDTIINGKVSTLFAIGTTAININRHVVAGSRGSGHIQNGTQITFSGDGSKLNFAEDSVVFGGSNSDYIKRRGTQTQIVSTVTGSREIVFDSFTGDFGAEIRFFSDASFIGNSTVNFTDADLDMWSVDNWNFSFGSSADFGDGINDFENDTLNFDLTGYTSGKWEVLTGVKDAFAGFDKADSVTIGGETATYQGADVWTSTNYKLALGKDGDTYSMYIQTIA